MPLLPIQIPPGVVRGASPNDAPNRWWNTNLVRWADGMLKPVGGWAKFTTTPFASTVRELFAWRSNTSDRLVIAATDTVINAQAAGSWNNITPAGITGLNDSVANGYGISTYGTGIYGVARAQASPLFDTRSFWSFNAWGEDVLGMASTDGRIFYYDITFPSTAMVQLGRATISSISRTSNVTTVTTSSAHGMTGTRSVTVAGVTDGTYNGTFNATTTGATTFTYPNTGSNGSSSGGTILDNTIPISCRGLLVTDERHVFAISAFGNGRRLAWCSRENLNDWDFASTTNSAGFLDLQTETPLLFGVRVREGYLIFSSNQVFLVRYVGQPFIYAAELLMQSAIYSIHSVAVFEGKAMWRDTDGFKIYANGTVEALQCPVGDWINSNVDAFYGPKRSFASANGIFSEIWWFFPAKGATECSRYAVYDYVEGWWAIGALDRTAMISAGATPLPIASGVAANHLYEHETGMMADGASMVGTQWAETSAVAGVENGVEARQLQIATGYGFDRVKARIYTRQTPEATERSFGPFTPRSSGYTDVRAAGKEMRIRIEGAVAGADWSIGTMRLEASDGGRR